MLSGYNTVVRIPAGATGIDVRQHSFSGKSEDDNYLGKPGCLIIGILEHTQPIWVQSLASLMVP